MVEKKVKLDTLDKIKKFVQKVSEIPEDVELATDRYVVDAKSILGVSSLDTTKPLVARIHGGGKRVLMLMEELDEFKGD